MTPLPKRRLSHKRQGKRRASFATKMASLIVCASCGKIKIPHTRCSNCKK